MAYYGVNVIDKGRMMQVRSCFSKTTTELSLANASTVLSLTFGFIDPRPKPFPGIVQIVANSAKSSIAIV
jgi:hypothetical protein